VTTTAAGIVFVIAAGNLLSAYWYQTIVDLLYTLHLKRSSNKAGAVRPHMSHYEFVRSGTAYETNEETAFIQR
jgi:hypothetical protein